MGYYDKNFNFINKYGGRYDMYGASSLRDLFTGENVRGVIKRSEDSKTTGRLRHIYQAANSIVIAGNIYFNYLMMMVDDAINGDVAQMTARRFPVMYTGLLSEDISNHKMRPTSEGIAPDVLSVDIRKLGYRLPRVLIHFGPVSPYADRVINVPKYKWETIKHNLKNGKVYPKFVSHKNPIK